MSAASRTAMRASQRSAPGGCVRRTGMPATSVPRPVVQHASISRRVCTLASRQPQAVLASSPLLHNAISRRYRRSLLWGALGVASLALSLVNPKPAEAKQKEEDMIILSMTAEPTSAKYEGVAFAAGVPPQAAREEAEEVVQEAVEKMRRQKQRSDEQQQRNKVEHKTN